MYMPVKAICEALDQSYKWIPKENRLYIGLYGGTDPAVMLSGLEWFDRHGSFYFIDKATDNYGKEYVSLISGDYYSGVSWQDYVINGQYASVKGTVILKHEYRDSAPSGYVKIFGDGELLFVSNTVNKGCDPEDFDIDIRNVQKLRVEFTTKGTRYARTISETWGIANCGLYR